MLNEEPRKDGSRRIGLTKFEKLIRDAIAVSIKRGEIKIPLKKTATFAAKRETQGQRIHQSDQSGRPIQIS
jgi:hypothetical protein